MSRVRTSLSSIATRKKNRSGSRALAHELVRLKVDLIIAGGPNDGLTAKKATKTIPIVFTDLPSDPVARGLVDSLAQARRQRHGILHHVGCFSGQTTGAT